MIYIEKKDVKFTVVAEIFRDDKQAITEQLDKHEIPYRDDGLALEIEMNLNQIDALTLFKKQIITEDEYDALKSREFDQLRISGWY